MQTSANEAPTVDQNLVNDLTYNFFNGKEHREFEEIGRDARVVRYKLKETSDSKQNVLIAVDSQSGMVIRQEFTEIGPGTGEPVSFVYEIRNLKSDVDDSLFEFPAGYRKVTSGDFYGKQNSNR